MLLLLVLIVLVVWTISRFFSKQRKSFQSSSGPTHPPHLVALVDAVTKTIGGRDIRHPTYEKAASQLSSFVSQGWINANDLLRQNAEKLFFVHREVASTLQGGMAVRFTVMYNLFGGTVMNLGNTEQQQQLQQILQKGELGCFALTEIGAGVLSGLIVETTATWSSDGTYIIHCPTDSSVKNWISQGLVANWAVVIARLLIPNKSVAGEFVDKGPHGFLVRIDNIPERNLEKKDMPRKTDFNDLDNATLRFIHCKVPHSSLLGGISYVDKNGEYVLNDPNVPFRFEHVAQRLLSGRICIAGAALSELKYVMNGVQNYKRDIPTGKDETTPLTQLPVLRDVLERAQCIHDFFMVYLQFIEKEYSTVKEITPKLVDQIAAAKILIVEFAIEMTMNIKAAVGSFSLQEASPFGSSTDILYVFRFAEGDTGVLLQKMTRDVVTRLSSKPLQLFLTALKAIVTPGVKGISHRQILAVAVKMMTYNKKEKNGKLKAWLNAHENVNRFAWIHSYLTIRENVLSFNPSVKGSLEVEKFDQYFERIL